MTSISLSVSKQTKIAQKEEISAKAELQKKQIDEWNGNNFSWFFISFRILQYDKFLSSLKID